MYKTKEEKAVTKEETAEARQGVAEAELEESEMDMAISDAKPSRASETPLDLEVDRVCNQGMEVASPAKAGTPAMDTVVEEPRGSIQ